jgi:hypothetical protein
LRDRNVGLRERPEQPLDLGDRDADPGIGHGEADRRPALGDAAESGTEGHASGRGKFHRVVDQIFQRRAQPHSVADDECRQVVGKLDFGPQSLCRCTPAERVGSGARQRAQVEEILAQAQARLLTARGIDEQRRQRGQMLGIGLDRIHPLPFAVAELRGREQIADGENARQRRAHVMGKRRQHTLDHRLRGRGSCSAPTAGGGFGSGLPRPLARRHDLCAGARCAPFRNHSRPLPSVHLCTKHAGKSRASLSARMSQFKSPVARPSDERRRV